MGDVIFLLNDKRETVRLSHTIPRPQNAQESSDAYLHCRQTRV